MLYFILMFPPVQYKKIGLMYGYSGFDQGDVSWSQLIMAHRRFPRRGCRVFLAARLALAGDRMEKTAG